MRWGVFALALALAIVLDTSFMAVFAIKSLHPFVTPCLVVFVCLHAQRQVGLWAAFAAGLAVDLTTPALFDGRVPYVLLGPTALGYVFGSQLALPLRSMVVRRNPLAVALVVCLFSIAAVLMTTAVYSVRGWYTGPWLPEHSALTHLRTGSLGALYSGVIAIVAILPLNAAVGFFGFTVATPWAPRRG